MKNLSKTTLKFLFVLAFSICMTDTFAATINFGPNGCTLQDAIRSANDDAPRGNCSAGSGVDVLISPDVWTITLSSRLPTITSDMTIRTATESGTLTISGDSATRIMKVTGENTELTLSRVIISDGDSFSGVGSGIEIVSAQVVINDSLLTNNSTSARFGGAIHITDGSLTINESYFQLNSATGVNNNYSGGGAIYAENSELEINSTTFVLNFAGYDQNIGGGGTIYYLNGFGDSICLINSELIMTASTINENNSGIYGFQSIANISNSTFYKPLYYDYHDERGHLDFRNFSTLTLNHVTIDAAMRVENSNLIMTNSIHEGDCNFSDTSNFLIDSHNILRTDRSQQTYPCRSTDTFYSFPRFLYLDFHGGLTKSFSLRHDSDAVDAGDPNYCLDTDQRGENRDALCDIGSYEVLDYVDIEASSEITRSPPYVHSQSLIYNAIIKNNSLAVANNIEVDLTLTNALIVSINSGICSAFPCVINSMQPEQEIIIPVQILLANFQNNFSLTLETYPASSPIYNDTNPANNNDTFSSVLMNGANLSVQMDLLTQTSHFIGEVIEYEAEIKNLSIDTATNATLTLDTVGLNILSFSGCNSTMGSTCNLGNQIGNSSKTITINAQITAAPFNAIAEVDSDEIDIDLRDNIDDIDNDGTIGQTEIDIGLADMSGSFYSYGYIQFTYKISAGNNPASNVRLWSYYDQAEFISCSYNMNFGGWCEIPSIPANTSVNVVLDYFNPIILDNGPTIFEHSVMVSAGETESNYEDNTVSTEMQIIPYSDIASQLELTSLPPYYRGQEIEFQLRVVNAGLNHAHNLNINLFPENLELLWASGNICQTVDCTIAQMNRFDDENITLRYIIQEVGDFNLAVDSDANEHDTNNNNNVDSAGGTATLLPNDLIFKDSFED